MFDLKTITGKNSVGNRLKESLGQTDRVLLNLQTNYNIRRLSQEIRHYFEMSSNVQEVLIYSGNKEISIKRNIVSSKGFLKMMMNCFR
jgi:plasmid maintenance system antidote protein VapI